MTETTGSNGRLGNQIIRNLAVSRVAEKHDLKVQYFNRDLISQLGIELYSGTNVYSSTSNITDDNYFAMYNQDTISCNLNPNNNYFQTREITNFLHDYLHSDKVKDAIIERNKYKERYTNNQDLFIHIRLKDVAHFNPGIEYYCRAIKAIQSYDTIYISTDDPNHSIIRQLCDLYPTVKLLILDEVSTIQFASTCKYIILSHGSFSAIIGYLSFFSSVYYPKYELGKIWYGDMFSIKNWVQLT